MKMRKCALIAVILVSSALCADRVTFNGRVVQPSFGSVAGVWFWSCGDAQLLLLGFEGRPMEGGVLKDFFEVNQKAAAQSAIAARASMIVFVVFISIPFLNQLD